MLDHARTCGHCIAYPLQSMGVSGNNFSDFARFLDGGSQFIRSKLGRYRRRKAGTILGRQT